MTAKLPDDLIMKGLEAAQYSIPPDMVEAIMLVAIAGSRETSSDLASLAAGYLSRADEDWTYINPDDIKRLAASVLSQANVD